MVKRLAVLLDVDAVALDRSQHGSTLFEVGEYAGRDVERQVPGVRRPVAAEDQELVARKDTSDFVLSPGIELVFGKQEAEADVHR